MSTWQFFQRSWYLIVEFHLIWWKDLIQFRQILLHFLKSMWSIEREIWKKKFDFSTFWIVFWIDFVVNVVKKFITTFRKIRSMFLFFWNCLKNVSLYSTYFHKYLNYIKEYFLKYFANALVNQKLEFLKRKIANAVKITSNFLQLHLHCIVTYDKNVNRAHCRVNWTHFNVVTTS